MTRSFSCSSIAAVVVLSAIGSTADARRWRDVSGTFSVDAELISHDDMSVKLRTPEGREITVPLNKLSLEDRNYVAQLEQGDGPRDAGDPTKALGSPADFVFVDAPLSQVLSHLEEVHQARIFVDLQSMKDVGISADAPITIQRRGISFAEGLSTMLKPLGLRWTVKHRSIFITTEETLELMLDTRAYRGKGGVDWDAVIKSVTSKVAPDSWESVGGPASVAVTPPHLVVHQTREAHQQIAKLIGKSLRPVQGKRATLVDIGLNNVAKQLSQQVDLGVVDTPLKDVAEYLSDAAKVAIKIDEKALDDVGLSPDSAVTANLKRIPLMDALDLSLSQLWLTWTVQGGGVLITTPEVAEVKLLLVRHHIADLAGPGGTTAQQLAEVIKAVINPDSWDEVGGTGSLRIGGGDLAIRQTPHTHLAVAQLLNDLRAKAAP